MLFNSLSFLIFFPSVVLVYFAIPHKLRWIWLLLASCRFYMEVSPYYILVLFLLILIDYVAAIYIEQSQGNRRRQYLYLSLLANIAILAVFKYFNFFSENIHALAQALHWNYSPTILSFILPIGLSFHTFQSMSYTIEVYRGQQRAERHLGIYALYVLFFPQLVAGPIERPQNLLQQFRERHQFDYDRVTHGLKTMLWGFFIKLVIADRLAPAVNLVYNQPQDFSGPALTLATIFFAIQIYCDFSGYSHIALGSAEVLGFRLMSNFNRPYAALSVSEFWRRWHISLSTWFRDYVYLALGGKTGGRFKHYRNIMLTFLLSGFWHGANWTFIVWGGLNGLYLIFADWTKDFRSKLTQRLGFENQPLFRFWRQACTFSLITFSWIFFRARNMEDAWRIVTNLGDGWNLSVQNFNGAIFDSLLTANGLNKLQWSYDDWLLTCLIITTFLIFHQLQKSKDFWQILSAKPIYLRWGVYYLLLYVIVVHGKYQLQEQFIYFRF